MRKRIVLTMLGMSMLCLLVAQERSPEIIAPAGGIDRTESISLEWTVGEFATETAYSNRNIISQGFHQPVLQVVKQINVDQVEFEDDFIVFPNPVQSILEVKIPTMEISEKITLRLVDMQGRLLLEQLVPEHLQIQQIDMSPFAQGNYLLKFERQSSGIITTFKIIKS